MRRWRAPDHDGGSSVVRRWVRRGLLALGVTGTGILLGAGAASAHDPAGGGLVPDLLDGVVTPVAEQVATPVIDEVVAPVVDEVVAPAVREVPAPVDEVVAPVAAEVAAPVVEEVAPAVDDVTAPVVDAVVPVIEDLAVPVVDEAVAPVVDEVVAPVVEDVAAPVVDAVAPVVEDLAVPVVDEVVAPVVAVTAPVVVAVTVPVRPVLEPLHQGLVDPVLGLVAPIVTGPVGDAVDGLAPVVAPLLPERSPVAAPPGPLAARVPSSAEPAAPDLATALTATQSRAHHPPSAQLLQPTGHIESPTPPALMAGVPTSGGGAPSDVPWPRPGNGGTETAPVPGALHLRGLDDSLASHLSAPSPALLVVRAPADSDGHALPAFHEVPVSPG